MFKTPVFQQKTSFITELNLTKPEPIELASGTFITPHPNHTPRIGSFTLKTNHMFSVRTMSREHNTATIGGHFGKPEQGNHMSVVALISECFRPYKNETSAFSISSSLKSVFEKVHFRDELVWTIGQTVEIKLCF